MESVLGASIAASDGFEDAVLFESRNVLFDGSVANNVFWEIVEFAEVSHWLATMLLDHCSSRGPDCELPLDVVQDIEKGGSAQRLEEAGKRN